MPDHPPLVPRVLLAAGLSAACHTTASIGSDIADDDTSSTHATAGLDDGAETTSSSESAEAGPTSGASGASGAETSAASGTDVTTGASVTTGAGDSDPTFTGGGTGGLCEPTPGEHPCIRCAKRNCCFETNACLEYPACECLLTCIEGNQLPWQCPQTCPYSNEGMALFGCVGFLCQQECG